MMTNLFSSFDPCTGIMSINWTSMMIVFFITPNQYWVFGNKIQFILMSLSMKLKNELKSIMPYKGSSLIMISLFMFILSTNIFGLLPYIFTCSSHLVFCLSLSLPLWVSLMMYGWITKTNSMFTHLLPTGTPSILMPFLVLIETISNMIRPGSLAVRLTANMIAGHLLMILLGSNSTTLVMLVLTMIIFISLMMFELAVAIIQSYVFMTLMNLYSSEI